MKYEKRSELLHDALNFLDEDMINDVEKLRNGDTKSEITPIEKKVSWRRWAALAASVCILISGSIIYRDYLIPKGNTQNTGSGAKEEEKAQSTGIVEGSTIEDKVGNNISLGQLEGEEEVTEKYAIGYGCEKEKVGKTIYRNCKDVVNHVIRYIQNLDEDL